MRQMFWKAGSIVAVMVLLAGCASTTGSGQTKAGYEFSEVERVGVVGVDGAGGGGSEAAENQFAVMFNKVLLEKGYSPVERQQIREVIKEQEFQNSDMTRAQNATAVGRILNVDAVVTINVPKYGETMEMSIQMMDPESAAVVWSASGNASTGMAGETGALIGGVTGAVAGSEMEGTAGAVAGGATGAAAGGLAGEQMSPQRREQSAKLMNKLSESLPKAAGAGM
ncbi:glycine zipper 2TM domain-containing protein [Thiohalorhabdus sp.]|uniref:glycine zipper 2TM domain-containing protein n=1 Tax=Thiohalorhabdus sp. TaxID=3094134 RepID=UPI002FC38E52